MEDNGNILGNVLNALVEKGIGDNGFNNFGGNGIWLIFFVFMMMFFGGGNFGNFGGWGNNFLNNSDVATKQDVAATAAWQATQNDIHTVNGNIDRLGQTIYQNGYNELAQLNNINLIVLMIHSVLLCKVIMQHRLLLCREITIPNVLL